MLREINEEFINDGSLEVINQIINEVHEKTQEFIGEPNSTRHREQLRHAISTITDRILESTMINPYVTDEKGNVLFFKGFNVIMDPYDGTKVALEAIWEEDSPEKGDK